MSKVVAVCGGCALRKISVQQVVLTSFIIIDIAPHAFLNSFIIANINATLGMQIYVTTAAGKSFVLEVGSEDTIEDVKARIERKEGISLDDQQLVFGERYLDDAETLSYYKVTNDSTLFLGLKPKSGKYMYLRCGTVCYDV